MKMPKVIPEKGVLKLETAAGKESTWNMGELIRPMAGVV